MPVPRRFDLSIAASFVALLLIPSGGAGRAPRASGQAEGTTGRAASKKWTDSVSELTTKILSHGSPQDTVGLAVRNISSLSEEDVSQIRRELRSELRSRGFRLAAPKQASIKVEVTLSENVENYVWVAEMQNGTSRDIAMVSFPRPPRQAINSTADTLSLQKVRLFEQAEPMLDIVPLDSTTSAPAGQAAPPASALVLSLDGVSLYERVPSGPAMRDQPDAAGWQLKQSAPIPRVEPWPRDPRGRLAVRLNNAFDVFQPGMECSGTTAPTLSLTCHEGDEPWPIGAGGSRRSGTAATALAYFSANRNFFDGRIRFGDGHESKVAPFFSAAPIPSGSGMTLLLAGLDGRAQLLNANAETVANIDGMGSDLVSVESGCASGGGLILASGSEHIDEPDAIQAYVFANHKAEAVGAPMELPGPVTALWPLPDGSSALVILRNLKTENYEAFRISVSCGR